MCHFTTVFNWVIDVYESKICMSLTKGYISFAFQLLLIPVNGLKKNTNLEIKLSAGFVVLSVKLSSKSVILQKQCWDLYCSVKIAHLKVVSRILWFDLLLQAHMQKKCSDKVLFAELRFRLQVGKGRNCFTVELFRAAVHFCDCDLYS